VHDITPLPLSVNPPVGNRRQRLATIRKAERHVAGLIKAELDREAPQPFRRHRMDDRVLYRAPGHLTDADVAEVIREIGLVRLVCAAGPQVVLSVIMDLLGLDRVLNLLGSFELTS
jgi:hypothetical protein